MPKSKTETLLEELLGEIKGLRDSITKPITSNLPEVPNEPTPTAPEPINNYPVPVEYREVVDSVLSKSFGLEVEPHADAPVSTVSIIVPEKYNTLSPSQKEILKVDRRPKVISFAEGLNGVRDWSEKVFKNLSPEIQAMVVADRMQGN